MGGHRRSGLDWLSLLLAAGVFAFLLFALGLLVWLLATQPGA